MKRVFVTTTDSIENAKIIDYKGLVSSNIVAGTGFLSDLTASFSDFFGGRSGTYRRQMENIYSEALDEISDKAIRKGANAVVGFRIDFDNISGKGMSMFMIAITGTAVIADFGSDVKEDNSEVGISSQMLELELNKRLVFDRIQSGDLDETTWDIILKCPQDDYAIPLSSYLLSLHAPNQSYAADPYLGERSKAAVSRFSEYIPLIYREAAIKAVYPLIDSWMTDAAINMIRNNQLFDSSSIISIIDKGLWAKAALILPCRAPSYNVKELEMMKVIWQRYQSLPDVGKYEVLKSGVFSKEGRKYVCVDGHINDEDVEFCTKCGKNIKGLSAETVKLFSDFGKTIDALESLLLKNQ